MGSSRQRVKYCSCLHSTLPEFKKCNKCELSSRIASRRMKREEQEVYTAAGEHAVFDHVGITLPTISPIMGVKIKAYIRFQRMLVQKIVRMRRSMPKCE
ncbi:uncharacterized protein LOC122505659 isoform X2 [Leptopilina heterotoma]|uniref:uncharacterized protein LOC122505659 isoform X2 n=1 Tax=Leptopilina heterotoma TaxID=63436 RepID=UPI001CA9E299|nr:uncharacterized protein LOC122505659 isoform X2 [Leptopilina heterotoma]